MNKKILLAVVLVLTLMVGLCACGSEPAVNTEPNASQDNAAGGSETAIGATAPTESGSTTAPTAPTAAEGEVIYTVKVVDKDGNGVENVAINMCNDEGCMFNVTNAQGYVYFSKPEGEWKVAFSEAAEQYYYFEAGSREITLVYDLAAATTESTEAATTTNSGDSMFNDAELDW